MSRLLSSRHPVRRASLIVAAAALSFSGCTSSGTEKGDGPDPIAPTASTSPEPTPNEATEPSVLTVEPSGGRTTCSSRTTRDQKVSLYDPIARARGDLTVTDVSATDSGVRFLDAEGVVVTSRPASGPGVLIGGPWPVRTNKELARKTDLSTRTELVGMKVADGQRILPLVRVVVDPHSRLDGIRLTYTWGDGTDNATVVLPVHTRFAARTC